MLKNLSVILLATGLLSSCVTVPNTREATVSGKLELGGMWAETETDKTGDLTFGEMIDMIEAQPERECTPVPGFNICATIQTAEKVKLPARGAAIIRSSEDDGKLKTALETACRELGKRCSYEVKAALRQLAKRKGHE